MGLRLHLAFSVLLLAPLVVLLLDDRRMFRRESAELARLTRQDGDGYATCRRFS